MRALATDFAIAQVGQICEFPPLITGAPDIGGEEDVRGLAAAVGLLTPLVVAVVAYADQASQYDYAVLRNGKEIGHYRVVAKPRGDGGEVELTFDSEMTVKFGFLPVFTYAHERRELWRDGELVHAAGTTTEDGNRYTIEIRAVGGGYVRTINNRVEALELDRLPLALFDPKRLNGHTSYFSLSEDKLLDVSFEFGGREVVTWWNGGALLDHYKMTGDDERELWYDMKGQLVRAKLRRRNSEIEFLLQP